LDVTTDAIVALWFALHNAVRDRKKRITFKPILPTKRIRRSTPPHPMDVKDVPSLYIYFNPGPAWKMMKSHPAVELAKIDALRAVAQRPHRQSAVSMPFGRVSFNWLLPRQIFPVVMTSQEIRWPTAIIKIHFPFAALDRPDMTADFLFPKDESLYARLVAAKAPYLAVYV
jgi:hypothetical protein